MNHIIAQFHRWDANSLCMLFLCCCIAVSFVMLAIAEARELLRARHWPRTPKGQISFRSNPSTTAGGAYAAPVEPQHTRRVMP